MQHHPHYMQRDGAPSEYHYTVLQSVDDASRYYLIEQGARQMLRVPNGEYSHSSMIVEPATIDFMELLLPELNVLADQAIDLDARTAKPLSVSVPAPAAQSAQVSVDVAFGKSGTSFFTAPDVLEHTFAGRLGPGGPVFDLTGDVQVSLYVPNSDGSFRNAATRYQLAWYIPGNFPTGLDLTAGGLAAVTSDYHQRAPGGVSGIHVLRSASEPEERLRRGVGSRPALRYNLPADRVLQHGRMREVPGPVRRGKPHRSAGRPGQHRRSAIRRTEPRRAGVSPRKGLIAAIRAFVERLQQTLPAASLDQVR